jgi:hypothetical protein
MMHANGYSRGVPPVTTYCNTYPMLRTMGGNLDSQAVAWGLSVDREFGGCKCADEDEMEFGPAMMIAGNTWACQCLNNDLYLAQPDYTTHCKVIATGTIVPPT